MYKNLPRPTVFAHRGASAYAPENTLASFRLAVQQNADAIELDAKLSADGHIVVIHDQTVERTTDGKGLVQDLPLAALKELDAGRTYDQAFRGERIPTLSEVFEAVGQQTFINIELKNYAAPANALPEKVAALVRKHNMVHRVLFSSFNPIALHRIHKLLPKTPICLLSIPGLAGAWARSPLGRWVPHQALNSAVRDLTKGLIARKQNNGYRVYVYTVNNPEQISRFLKWGVDGIFTDDPPLARRTIKAETR
ncbi:MAG: glycerophosphodiester phosphodiesterase family protein [Chloroflexota bacterium]|nr:glycerophosphodiester phosphodiesterase family protein [Chloroflexota bacterium]